MRLFFFDIPHNKDELVLWLEDMILSENFDRFYNELIALYDQKVSFGLSDKKLSEIIVGGFANFDENTIRKIIRDPDLLLKIHNKILFEGEQYWNSKALRLQPPVKAFNIHSQLSLVHSDFIPQEQTLKRNLFFYSSYGMAIAAGIFLLLSGLMIPKFTNLHLTEDKYVFNSEKLPESDKPLQENSKQTQPTNSKPPGGVSVAWGWAKPDAIPDDFSPQKYLMLLANSGNEWFKKNPSSPFEISKRILEFRTGCNVLNFAEHKCLDERDKKWLINRCKSFSRELDDSIVKLENGHDASIVKNELDQKVKNFLDAIRSRSDSVG